MRVYLTGAFRLEIRGEPVQLPTRKTRSLLAYLILHPGAHSREILAALYWGDSPDPAARSSLRRALTLLRKYIDDDLILADRETVQLNPSYPMWVDLRAFEQQAEGLEQFKSLPYEGDLLVDLYDEWILPLRTHYQGQYVDLLLRGVEQARGQSEYPLAIEYAQKVLKCDPANERAHQHLMFCYITLGERNKALEQYETCQRVLQDELAVEPTQETQVLHRWIKQYEAEPTSLAARITNLPIPISSFVGRGRELSKIKGMVANNRLVTLTGPGGSGKTRLAIHAATDLIDQFKDGVWWVELALVTEPSLIPFAVESGSNQPITETLKKYLYTRKALIILDNCEHLIEASAHLAESLLTCCVDLKVLATSREALCLVGESLYIVPPLTLPETETISLLDLLMKYEGVRLFIERAIAINPEFTPSDMNAVAITQVCQRLDGIPLGIELAAARVKNMTVEQIAIGLDNACQLLTSRNRTSNLRHQTLRAAIDWSYELLSEVEKQLFCRLFIFAGGWTLEAAEAVCSGEGVDNAEITDLLQRLVDKSLITLSAEGQRYGMLETIRQYAKEKILRTGHENWITKQHLEYFLNHAETADEKIRGPEQLIWFQWLDNEQDNLKVAIQRSLNTPVWVEMGINLVCALCWYWYTVGEFVRMKLWMENALHQSACLGRVATRAKILFCSGAYSAARVYWLNHNEASEVLEESLEIWREIGSEYKLEMAQSLMYFGYARMNFFKEEKGIDYLFESIEIFKELGNHWWHAWALAAYGLSVGESMEYAAYRPVLEEIASLWKKAGDRQGQANVLMDMGELELSYGKFSEAEAYLKQSKNIFMEFKARGYLQLVLRYLGNAALGLKNYKQARRYYEEDIQLASMLGQTISISTGYHLLSYTMLHLGDDQQAEEYLYQALKIAQENDYQVIVVYCLMNNACLATVRNKTITATRFFSAFDTNIKMLHAKLGSNAVLFESQYQIVEQQELNYYLTLCQAQIDKTEFDRAWNEGTLLSVDEVIGEILKEGIEV